MKFLLFLLNIVLLASVLSCKKKKEPCVPVRTALPDTIKSWIPDQGDTFTMISSKGITQEFYLKNRSLSDNQYAISENCDVIKEEYSVFYQSTYAGDLRIRVTSDTLVSQGQMPLTIFLDNSGVRFPLSGESGVLRNQTLEQNVDIICRYERLSEYAIDSNIYKDVYRLSWFKSNNESFRETQAIQFYLARHYGLIQFTQQNGVVWRRL